MRSMKLVGNIDAICDSESQRSEARSRIGVGLRFPELRIRKSEDKLMSSFAVKDFLKVMCLAIENSVDVCDARNF